MYAGRIVEKGIARDIYERPRHPYTVGLLKSVPRLDVAVKQRLVPIEGAPPDLGNLPKGCAFAERCTHLIGRCKEEMPFLVPVSDKHEVACWVDIGNAERK
jgi:oligopeptide transport system ATP-binding protein